MLSEYLLLLTTAVVFNTCTAVLYPPNPLKLRVAVHDWMGVDQTSNLWDSVGSHIYTSHFLLAAKLFNDRRDDLIPALASIKNCNKQLQVTTVCDNSGSPRRAAHDARYVIDQIGADAFVGFGGLETSFVGSMIGYDFNIPVIDHWTSAVRTSKRRDFPFYARTIPSDETNAVMLATLIEQLGFKRLVVLHLNDGDEFAASLYNLLKAKGIEATLVQFKYAVGDNTIRDRVAYVKSLALNVIVCAAWLYNVPEIADAAKEFNLLGPEMLWIMTYISRAPYKSEFAYFPNVTELFSWWSLYSFLTRIKSKSS